MSPLDIARVANIGKHGIALPQGTKAGIETSSHFTPERAAYASGAYAALVEVDPGTGGVTILRYVIVHDRGNVMHVDGRVLGGFAHGIVNATYDEPVHGAEAQSASCLDHALVPAMEVPEAGLSHVHGPSPLNPLGVKGAGEGGTIPAPAAIANAVEDAPRPFRARVNRAPVTPARSVEATYGDDRIPPEGPQ